MLHTQTVTAPTLDLLKTLMAMPKLRQFALVGGTNLALRFGHRLSIDLDLFTNEPFNAELLYQSLEIAYSDIILASQSESMLFVFLNKIKVDCVLLPYPYLNPIENFDGIRMVSLEDIAAMKLSAIASRGVKKDFWDMAELLHYFSLEEMIGFYQVKYRSRDIFHLLRSLVYFEDAEAQKDPRPLKSVTWQEVKLQVEQAAKQYIENSL